MANVMFKRGLQASLPTGNNILDGVFYLTTDTGRLYVGQDNEGTKALVELNKSITTITGIQSADGGGYEVTTPTSGIRPVKSGEFYYYAASNMLLIGQDSGKLLQINPDTDIHVGSGTLTITEEASGGIFALNEKIYNTNSNGSAQTTTAIVDSTVKFAKGDNVTLAVDNNVLTINADDSVLSAGTATGGANLSVDGGDGVDIVGNGGTTVSIVNGKIQISSGSTTGFTYTLSGYTDGGAPTANGDQGPVGRRQIHLENGSGTSQSNVYLPIPKVVLGGTDTDTSTAFASTVDTNGYDVITLPVYSKKQIEEKLSGITSPLNYKGSASTLPSSNQKNGDVYLISANLNNPAAKIGDLAIWNSSLNSGAGGWDIIPSGNDQNITATVSDNLLKISDTIASNTTGNIATIGYNNEQDTNKTKIQFTSGGNGTHDYRLSASLPEYYATAPTAVTATSGTTTYGGSVTIPSVTVDKYGRVTGLSSSSLTLPSAQTLTGSIDTPAPGAGDQSFSISLSNSGGTAQFYTKSLTVSTTGSGANAKNYIDLVWGTF